MAKINCSKTASGILKHYYGYDSFRPLQEEIIGSTLQGRDSLVLMPTGGGKSLCFQIPALMLQGMAIVVSPLISLMKDQVAALQGNGIAAEALNSGNDERENMAIKMRCEHGDIKLLYTSPERLLSELEWIKGNIEVSFFAIDEAHCISQWGHDFRPEYAQLERIRDEFPGVPVIALTATADKITKGDILEKLHIDPCNQYVSSFDRPNLSLDVKRGYSSRDKLTAILNIIKRHQGESGIIYCLSRKNTEDVALKLKLKGIKAEAYHAGQSITKRDKVQDDFLNDRIDVVVATIAFGMGIDKSNVRYVIHYNLPKSIESFFQEIGRGGRDGLPCETLLFYNIQDLITLRSFADNSGQQEINHEKLNRMQEYAEAQVCRRRILLNYFGEPSDRGCGNCDVCLNPPVRFDGTVPVQMALSAIMRTGQNATSRMIIEILVGSASRELRNKGYDRLKTYGAGRAIPFRDWQDYMLQMLQMGFFEIAYNEDNHLKVTALGQDVLYGRAKAELVVIDRTAGDTKSRMEKKDSESRTREARKKPAELPGLTDDSKEDIHLFEALRGLRREIADELGVPAFVVMSDRTLHALATYRPLTKEAFATIHGIGEHKSTRYGARFILFIKEHIDKQ